MIALHLMEGFISEEKDCAAEYINLKNVTYFRVNGDRITIYFIADDDCISLRFETDALALLAAKYLRDLA